MGSLASAEVRHTLLVGAEGMKLQVEEDMTGDNRRVDGLLNGRSPCHACVVLLDLKMGHSCDMRELNAHTLGDVVRFRHQMIAFSFACADS